MKQNIFLKCRTREVKAIIELCFFESKKNSLSFNTPFEINNEFLNEKFLIKNPFHENNNSFEKKM